jgi:glycosyltransferase involved in cell wall biosynthesis
MRIAMMADVYKPHISGITNYIETNKRYLEQAGHEVYVFTMGASAYSDDEPNIIRSRGLPMTDAGLHLNFFYSRSAKALLQTMDVAHVHHPFLSGTLALRYCQPKNIPIVFTNHTRYDLYMQTYMPALPDALGQGFLEAYMPTFCEAVDLVISPSNGMAEVLRQLKVEAPIAVVPNGVDIQRFMKVKQPLERAEFGFKPEDILVIYAGRVAPEKNLPLLIDAFAGVAQAVENVRLLILGDGPALEELQKKAGESMASQRIQFVGRVDYDQVPPYLAMCDTFVTPSVSEVHPLSVIEGMAAGLPVLGIRSPGVSDTVEHGVTGLLSENDLASFAAQLTRLCLQSEFRKQMGKAARKASLRYDITKTAPAVVDQYKAIIRDHRPRERGISRQLRKILEKLRA